MKRNVILIIFLLILVLLDISCKKEWLNEKPDNTVVIPASYDDFQAILDNINLRTNEATSLGEIYSDGHYVLDETLKNQQSFLVNTYKYAPIAPYESGSNWVIPYQCVFSCNLVLDGLLKLKPQTAADEARWRNIKGQALFIRALKFYNLAQVYAPFFDQSTAAHELGIPLRLESDPNLLTKRSTLKETYEQIINDLKLAADYLKASPKPNSVLTKSRASEPAALGLLARIYLSIEDYPNAYRYSNETLKIYNDLLIFSDLGAQPIPLFHQEIIFRCSLSGYTILGYNARIADELYASYSDHDLRKTKFFTKNLNSTISFKVFDGTGIFSSFAGIATDEMYLIRAESQARLGNPDEAMKDLNTLLKTRWTSASFYVDQTASSAKDAVVKIINERKKELLLRGLRWSDLRRLNRDPSFAITLTRIVDGKTYTLEPNSYKYTFPIDNLIIQATGIQQNAGW
jgi:tetratricopeptide (TPR) repeat protein